MGFQNPLSLHAPTLLVLIIRSKEISPFHSARSPCVPPDRRDVCLNDDHCGLRLPNLAHDFAILNNWVLGLFALSGGGNFAAAQRLFNAQPDLALNLLLRQDPTFE